MNILTRDTYMGFEYRWKWMMGAAYWLSYNLGIGQVFGDEYCEVCDCPAVDADYNFKRVGRKRARCVDTKQCAENVEDEGCACSGADYHLPSCGGTC